MRARTVLSARTKERSCCVSSVLCSGCAPALPGAPSAAPSTVQPAGTTRQVLACALAAHMARRGASPPTHRCPVAYSPDAEKAAARAGIVQATSAHQSRCQATASGTFSAACSTETARTAKPREAPRTRNNFRARRACDTKRRAERRAQHRDTGHASRRRAAGAMRCRNAPRVFTTATLTLSLSSGCVCSMTRMNSLPVGTGAVSNCPAHRRRGALRALRCRSAPRAGHVTALRTELHDSRRAARAPPTMRSAEHEAGAAKRATRSRRARSLRRRPPARPPLPHCCGCGACGARATRTMTTPAPAGLLATPLSSRQTRFTLPPPPPPLTPGRPGLDRVLDLVTEHETHYRHQARAALQRAGGSASLPRHRADSSCVRTPRVAPGAAHGGACEATCRLRGAA